MTMQREQIAQRRADMPKQYRKLYDRVVAGKASPRDAIKMQCLECFGWVKIEMVRCDSCACPLFGHRPYQKLVKSPRERLEQTNEHELREDGS